MILPVEVHHEFPHEACGDLQQLRFALVVQLDLNRNGLCAAISSMRQRGTLVSFFFFLYRSHGISNAARMPRSALAAPWRRDAS